MTKELQIFKHDQFGEVRVVLINDEPWWVAADICQVLELGNPRSSLALLDDDEKDVHTVDTPGGSQQMAVINEPGLYSLILRSRKSEAKIFKRWICHEVVPAIRKHGGYIAAPPDASPEDIMARAILAADATIKKLKGDKAPLESKIEADRPRVAFSEAVDASPDCLLLRDFAVVLRQNQVNIGEVRLFAWMRENDWLVKEKGASWNMPTQRAMNLGLFRVKETLVISPSGNSRIRTTPKLTSKGQKY